MNTERTPVVILGAGPAGVGAAFQLARRGCFDVTVVERGSVVGGNAASFELCGLRLDYGSHRLHPSCAPEILADIRSLLGESLLDRPRHGRIRLRGKWVHFPLKPIDLILHLPFSFLGGVARDALSKMIGRAQGGSGQNFQDVLEQGLGRTICRDFYFPYARKIWGLPPEQLDAEQARRRVSAGSLGKMVRKVLSAVPGLKPPGTGRFFYPRNGYGAISEAYSSAAARAGATLRSGATVTGISMGEGDEGKDASVEIQTGQSDESLPARLILSTIPMSALVRAIRPAAPATVLEAAGAMRFRGMLLVYLVLETDRFTEFDAHYFPDSDVAITRLSEPKNYGLATAPGITVLCAEMPCNPEERLWQAANEQLRELLVDVLARAGLPVHAPVRQIVVKRLPQAYPIYTAGYREHFDHVDSWLAGLQGLVTFGRQGLFAHDNTHHALAMAYALSDCLDEAGRLDQNRWAAHRLAFQEHVVED